MDRQFPKHLAGFTFSNKRKRYERSNVFFDPIKERAYSYEHWLFVKRIGGKMVFNTYSYSRTTTRHQGCVFYLMRELGYSMDSVLRVECPSGLNRPESFFKLSRERISLLQSEINNPRSRKSKNAERLKTIETIEKYMNSFNILLNEEILESEIRNLLEEV